MAARLSANLTRLQDRLVLDRKLHTFLYANGLNAQAITGKSVSEQFKSLRTWANVRIKLV